MPDTQPKRYTPTGEMDADGTHISFGAEGDKVVVMCDGGDIVLSRADQDLFARHYFRAVGVADLDVGGAPF
jgi:hypothetical protein